MREKQVTAVAGAIGVAHPLEPLTAEEVGRASDILRAERNLHPEHMRFVSVSLHEPPKETVLSSNSDSSVEREAFVSLLDNEQGRTYEAIVSLSSGKLSSWRHVPDVQPSIMFDEILECERACKANPEWQAAMRKRGITDFDLCMVDPWSAGNFGIESENGRRIVRALTWVRVSPKDNGYARPVENVAAIVDLHAKQVIAVEDYGVVPIGVGRNG